MRSYFRVFYQEHQHFWVPFWSSPAGFQVTQLHYLEEAGIRSYYSKDMRDLIKGDD